MSRLKYQKVLIVSHNPLSDQQNNGKTLTSFFEGWHKDKLAQLYLTTDVPSFRICDQYFRITDLEILRSFMSLRKARGATVEVNDMDTIASEKARLGSQFLYSFDRSIFQSRSPFAYFIRSTMWSRKRWQSVELEDWVIKFKHYFIFFQSSNCSFAFDIVKHLCTTYNIPLMIEVTDDYVTPHFSLNPFYWFEILRLIKRFSWAVGYSHNIITIGDKMANEYRRRFGGEYFVAMNNVDTSAIMEDKMFGKTSCGHCTLLYAGNLGLNRWKVLLAIGKSLSRINQYNNNKSNIIIYSLEPPSKHVLGLFKSTGTMEYCGSANSEELISIRQSADILLHVESFDKKNIAITRLSVSTKIPEYMASGRCILAVGPKEVASLQYVEDFDIGMTINSLESIALDTYLQEIIADSKLRYRYISNAQKVVRVRHSAEATKKKIKGIINDIVK